MYKEDLTLNTLQWLICHKTKPDTIDYNYLTIKLLYYMLIGEGLNCHRLWYFNQCFLPKYFELLLAISTILLYCEILVLYSYT